VPETARRYYREAQARLSRSDSAAAAARLERALALAPDFAPAWNLLGTIAYHNQQFARAEMCFREALRADPAYYDPLVNLGGVLINLGKLDEAMDFNVRAVASHPADALANAQLGLTYFHLGRYDLATKHLRKALEIDPAHFSYPQLVLAEIDLRRHDRLAAAADLEDFLKHHPDYPTAALMLQRIDELRR
jgi:tetratricopeptide (TPR) repeat protein